MFKPNVAQSLRSVSSSQPYILNEANITGLKRGNIFSGFVALGRRQGLCGHQWTEFKNAEVRPGLSLEENI